MGRFKAYPANSPDLDDISDVDVPANTVYKFSNSVFIVPIDDSFNGTLMPWNLTALLYDSKSETDIKFYGDETDKIVKEDELALGVTRPVKGKYLTIGNVIFMALKTQKMRYLKKSLGVIEFAKDNFDRSAEFWGHRKIFKDTTKFC